MARKITRLAREVGGCLVVSIPVDICRYENIEVGDHVEIIIRRVNKNVA